MGQEINIDEHIKSIIDDIYENYIDKDMYDSYVSPAVNNYYFRVNYLKDALIYINGIIKRYYDPEYEEQQSIKPTEQDNDQLQKFIEFFFNEGISFKDFTPKEWFIFFSATFMEVEKGKITMNININNLALSYQNTHPDAKLSFERNWFTTQLTDEQDIDDEDQMERKFVLFTKIIEQPLVKKRYMWQYYLQKFIILAKRNGEDVENHIGQAGKRARINPDIFNDIIYHSVLNGISTNQTLRYIYYVTNEKPQGNDTVLKVIDILSQPFFDGIRNFPEPKEETMNMNYEVDGEPNKLSMNQLTYDDDIKISFFTETNAEKIKEFYNYQETLQGVSFIPIIEYIINTILMINHDLFFDDKSDDTHERLIHDKRLINDNSTLYTKSSQIVDLSNRCNHIIFTLKDNSNITNIITLDGHGRTIYLLLYYYYWNTINNTPSEEFINNKFFNIFLYELEPRVDDWHNLLFPKCVYSKNENIYEVVFFNQLFWHNTILYLNFTGTVLNEKYNFNIKAPVGGVGWTDSYRKRNPGEREPNLDFFQIDNFLLRKLKSPSCKHKNFQSAFLILLMYQYLIFCHTNINSNINQLYISWGAGNPKNAGSSLTYEAYQYILGNDVKIEYNKGRDTLIHTFLEYENNNQTELSKYYKYIIFGIMYKNGKYNYIKLNEIIKKIFNDYTIELRNPGSVVYVIPITYRNSSLFQTYIFCKSCIKYNEYLPNYYIKLRNDNNIKADTFNNEIYENEYNNNLFEDADEDADEDTDEEDRDKRRYRSNNSSSKRAHMENKYKYLKYKTKYIKLKELFNNLKINE